MLARYEYDYDFSGLLANEILDHITDSYDQTATYGYDQRGQLISALYDDGQADQTLSYDANGNRTMVGYVTGPSNQLLSDGVYRYTYDAEGNMVTKTQITGVAGDANFTEYQYDFGNRMTKVTQYSKAPSDGGIVLSEESYRYDALGRRIQIVSRGEETISVYNGRGSTASEWARLNANGELVQRFLFTNRIDQLVAQWSADQGVAWALTDQLGSIRDMMNNAKQIIQHIQYAVYGTPTFSVPDESSHPLAFTGRVWDSIPGSCPFSPTGERGLRVTAPVGVRVCSDRAGGHDGGDAQSRTGAVETRGETPESGLRRPHAIRVRARGTGGNGPLRSSLKTVRLAPATKN